MLQSTPVDAVTTAAPPPLSPWLSIWFSPRRTIRRIVDSEERPNWWPVIALVVFGQLFVDARFDSAGALNLSGSLTPVIVGALQTVLSVSVGPFVLAFVGSWLGGEADPRDIRQAVAWSYVPFAVGGLVAIPLVFTNDASPVAVLLAAGSLGIAAMLCAFWTIVTLVITTAELQRFSIPRSIASNVIPLAPILLLLLLV